MSRFFAYFRPRQRLSKMVRPWALAAPILVLLISLPLLRPLRHPDPRSISDDEQARLASVQAIVEHHTLAIDSTDFTTTQRKVEVRDRWYSDQPPMMSAMLSGAYWIMHRNGLTFHHDAAKVIYLLTVLGVTIPAACAAGLVYRMGRLFELKRPWRALLAAASVLATGLISYATVLNPHVPAATLVLASAACLIHVTIVARRAALRPLWLVMGGFCAALSTAIDPSALPFLLLFLVVIPAMRWAWWQRIGGLLAYAVGAALPIALHVALTVPVTGDLLQGMGTHGAGLDAWGHPTTPGAVAPDSTDPSTVLGTGLSTALGADDDTPQGLLPSIEQSTGRMLGALLGGHGVLSHFPILLLGILGVTMVMHRHWPSSAKVLASATLGGAVILVAVCAIRRADHPDWRDAMFAARWFIVFGPLVLFWSGAWLRRSHRIFSWVLAGILLFFSVAVSLIGATGPWPRGGYDHYTAAAALSQLVHPPVTAPQAVAGR